MIIKFRWWLHGKLYKLMYWVCPDKDAFVYVQMYGTEITKKIIENMDNKDFQYCDGCHCDEGECNFPGVNG